MGINSFISVDGYKLNTEAALVNKYEDVRDNGLYYDLAIFPSSEHNELVLSTELPKVGDVLMSYSYKHISKEAGGTGIFVQRVESEELHISEAVVRKIIGNYIICDMSEPLEEGRSGSPLIKDGKLYGVLHGGVNGSPCLFLSSVAINESIYDVK